MKAFKIFAVVLGIAAISFGLIPATPTYYTLTEFTQVKGLKAEQTCYLSNGTTTLSYPVNPTYTSQALVNTLVAEGYTVDQWVYQTTSAGTASTTIICVLKK